MTQQRKLTRKEKIERAKQSTVIHHEEKKKKVGGNNLKLSLGLIAAAFGFLLYIATVNYNFVLDDYLSIKKNFVVQQGMSGIPTILKTSYRYGYWASNDELYRPLSLVLFAVEWSFFPDNPFVAHLVNILLYALTGFLLFNLLSRLFKNNYLISFAATMLFIAHPVHTEVVANIKSADEIISFLLSIISINLLLDYIETGKAKKMVFSTALFFLALMAKESALTFLAVIPLLLFVFKDLRIGKAISAVIPLGAAAVCYIAVRAAILNGIIHTKAIAALDNVLVSAPDFISLFGTAVYVLGRYLLLLAFQHLSYDYSINEIAIMKFTDYRVLISLAVYLVLIVYAVYAIRKKDIVSFCILFFLFTISIVSNIFIIIGTVMADRLLYLPSLGFCLAVAVLLNKIFKTGEKDDKITKLVDFIKANSKPFIALFVILALYSFKTIDRIPVWKSNWALYQSGIKDSPNSSKCHYLVALELSNTIVNDEPDSLKRIAIYKHSIEEYKKAIELYPKNFDAYSEMGVVYEKMGDAVAGLAYCDTAIQINPGLAKLYNNKGIILFRRQAYAVAKDMFNEAVLLDPRFSDAIKNLGSCYGALGDYDNALTYLLSSLKYERDTEKIIDTYKMIGMAYQYMGNKTLSDEYYAKAKESVNKGN